MKEPLIHSHITDDLPEGHRLTGQDIYCKKCDEALHMGYGECMQTWIETGEGNFCIKCWLKACEEEDTGYGLSALRNNWGLE